MGTLIDTSILVDLERLARPGQAPVLGDDYFLSVVTVSEMLVGIYRGTPEKREKRRAFIEQVMVDFVILEIDEPIARVHAKLTADMMALGRPPGVHDLWIAATAIHHDLDVLTRDTHSFPHIPGVCLVPLP